MKTCLLTLAAERNRAAEPVALMAFEAKRDEVFSALVAMFGTRVAVQRETLDDVQ